MPIETAPPKQPPLLTLYQLAERPLFLSSALPRREIGDRRT